MFLNTIEFLPRKFIYNLSKNKKKFIWISRNKFIKNKIKTIEVF